MVLGLIKSRLESKKPPITLKDCESYNNWSLNLNDENTKICSTGKRGEPRYVITDSSQDKDVVYTDSLASCIGVLIYENKGKKSIAGLAHLMPRESKIAAKMLKEIDEKYRPSKLNVVLAVGDDPDPKSFKKTVEVLLNERNISKNRFKVVYGGKGEPYFKTQQGKGTESSKIAYETKKQQIHIGRS